MTCGLGRVASRPPSVEDLWFIWCGDLLGCFGGHKPRALHPSDGSLGAAESAGPYHTKLRILFSYFLIKKCLRYFSSNPNNNLNYNLHVCLVPNYIVLCTVSSVNMYTY
jgi:hypothetical protein